ncbi:MAG: hypothetical protein MUF66_03705 [Gammaproteobacteria bacterium]|jgi:hypothetical protein|nr:hypothetical protein [Gammaproteobacteria bacterium]
MRKIVATAAVAGAGLVLVLAGSAGAVPPPECPSFVGGKAADTKSADAVSAGNVALQGNSQQVWLNQQPCQAQPVALAAADASATGASAAGGRSAGAVASGNGAIFSLTVGGLAGAQAGNDNAADAAIGQLNVQGARQVNGVAAIKLTLANVALGL